MSGHVPDPALKALEAALAGLTPAPAALDRDRLMFAAGAQSVRRRAPLSSWAWPAATAALAVATVTLSVLLATRPAARPAERIVVVAAPNPAPVASSASPVPVEPTLAHAATRPSGSPDDAESRPAPYWVLRQQVARLGLDALPVPGPMTATVGGPSSPRPEPLDAQLGLPPDALGPAMTRRLATLVHPGDPS